MKIVDIGIILAVVFVILIFFLIFWIAYGCYQEKQATITKTIKLNNFHHKQGEKSEKIITLSFTVTGNFTNKKKKGKIIDDQDLNFIVDNLKSNLENKTMINFSEVDKNNEHDGTKFFIMEKDCTLENISSKIFHLIKKETKKYKIKLVEVKLFNEFGDIYSFYRYHPSYFSN